MGKKLNLYHAATVFWLISLVLLTAGFLMLQGYTLQSVVLVLSGMTTFILGGLVVIYAELLKEQNA